MKNKCIICDQRTGSREHIFPAALGGRRVNKKIYCGKHNNGFSPLAKILSDQLAAINSLLSVRPDHSDEPCSFKADTPSGDTYILSGSRVELAPPLALDELKIDVPCELTMSFSSQKQADQWLAEQRKRGYSVQFKIREVGTKYSFEPLHIKLMLGGHESLRAIGYVALTFFAHYFPELVRQTGILKLKEFVQGVNKEELVWWDAPGTLSRIAPNSYRFGHTVAITVSAVNKEAYARISLFSAFDFAVQIGTVESDSDQTVIVHINPQSERPPDDICEMRDNVLSFMAAKPLALATEFEQIIKGGRAQESCQLLFEKIHEWHLESTAQQVLSELNEIHETNKIKRMDKIKAIVDKQGQRILNLLLYVINDMKQEFANHPYLSKIMSQLDALIAPDKNTQTGLSQFASAILEIAKVRLVEEIEKDFSNGELELGRISMLLGGGTGALVISETIFDIVLGQL
jgi:hypothetical protein